MLRQVIYLLIIYLILYLIMSTLSLWGCSFSFLLLMKVRGFFLCISALHIFYFTHSFYGNHPIFSSQILSFFPIILRRESILFESMAIKTPRCTDFSLFFFFSFLTNICEVQSILRLRRMAGTLQ